MLKVDEQTWRNRVENLMRRRKEVGHTNDNFRTEKPVSNYGAHLRKCYVGQSVLDVGCGGQHLKKWLAPDVFYTGLDPFPIVEGTIEAQIETFRTDRTWETVCAFATLDSCQDLGAALESMKRLASVNVIILTGIGIKPDEFHTFKIELHDIDEHFHGWANTRREEVAPYVWLLEYIK